MLAQKIRNFDIWWHLKTGEYILTNHFVPKFDIFSYTVPNHRWVNHQWLADILFFSVFNRFGITGLILLKGLALAATFTALLAMVYRKKLYIFSVAALLLAVLASSHRFLIRPFIFNFFFTAVYFYILHSYKYRNKKNLPFANKDCQAKFEYNKGRGVGSERGSSLTTQEDVS